MKDMVPGYADWGRKWRGAPHGGFKVVDANGQTLAYVYGLRYPADLV
jgi:hypothetical protein